MSRLISPQEINLNMVKGASIRYKFFKIYAENSIEI